MLGLGLFVYLPHTEAKLLHVHTLMTLQICYTCLQAAAASKSRELQSLK